MTICIYIQEEKKVIDYSDMKVKRLFLILSIFSFIPLSALAQGYIPDPDIQNEEFKEIDRQRAEEEKQKASESEGSSPQTSKKGGKIKELYNDFIEKSDEVNEKQKITGSQLVADFITDKLPLTLDLGAEPGEHGSTIFGVFQYDWNEKRASRLRLEYSSLKDSSDSTNWFSLSEDTYDKTEWFNITKKRGIEIDFYPYLKYYGDDSVDAYSPFFYFGLGAFYAYSWYDITASYWLEKQNERWMIKVDTDADYHQFGPMLIASIKIPFFTYFGAAIELDASPINRLISYSNSRVAYFSNTETPEYYINGDEEKSNWCSPTLKLDVALDFLTYFRLRTKFGYSKIYLSLSDIHSDSVDEGENKQETFIWRYGAEIVFPSSNKTRKKDSHLWAGLYYEHGWEKTTTNSTSTTNHSGKWIFCFGT